MNHPSASVYKEIEAFGQAKYDFLDLTIEGPGLTLDVERVGKLLNNMICLSWGIQILVCLMPIP